MLVGIVFSAGFEYLMAKLDSPRKNETDNWKRLVWITAWPYCALMFFVGMFKK
jgi:hypothetical protein